MSNVWSRAFRYALAIAALAGFVVMGTSCKKDEPKEEPASVQKDESAKADDAAKKEDSKKADKKTDEKKDEGAKADEKADDEKDADAKNVKYPLFKFTLKYTPETARVGVLNGKSDCKDGTCEIETTSETEPMKINVYAEGYENKDVTVEKKVETMQIDLVKLPEGEK